MLLAIHAMHISRYNQQDFARVACCVQAIVDTVEKVVQQYLQQKALA